MRVSARESPGVRPSRPQAGPKRCSAARPSRSRSRAAKDPYAVPISSAPYSQLGGSSQQLGRSRPRSPPARLRAPGRTAGSSGLSKRRVDEEGPPAAAGDGRGGPEGPAASARGPECRGFARSAREGRGPVVVRHWRQIQPRYRDERAGGLRDRPQRRARVDAAIPPPIPLGDGIISRRRTPGRDPARSTATVSRSGRPTPRSSSGYRYGLV